MSKEEFNETERVVFATVKELIEESGWHHTEWEVLSTEVAEECGNIDYVTVEEIFFKWEGHAHSDFGFVISDHDGLKFAITNMAALNRMLGTATGSKGVKNMSKDAFNEVEHEVFSIVKKLTKEARQDDFYNSDDLIRVGSQHVAEHSDLDDDTVTDIFARWDNENRFGYVVSDDDAFFVITSMTELNRMLGTATGTKATIKNTSKVVTKTSYTVAEAEAEKARIRKMAEQEKWSAGTTAAYLAHVSRRLKTVA